MTADIKQRMTGWESIPRSLHFSMDHYQKTFAEIIRSVDMNLEAAVDFTLSNGGPQYKWDLHNLAGKGAGSDYENALINAGSILLKYDTDEEVPMWEFGAAGSVDHPKRMLASGNDPKGLEQMSAAYRLKCQTVKLGNCTYFAPVLKQLVDRVKREEAKPRAANEKKAYYVLMLLTDGQNFDTEETKEQICKASKLPISIVIVGIGNSDELGAGGKMDELDGDEGRLMSKVKGHMVERQERDNVQFVKYNNFKNLRTGDVDRDAEKELAKAVLYELPGQVEEYAYNAKHLGW